MEEDLKLRAFLENRDLDVTIEDVDGQLRVTVGGHSYTPLVQSIAGNSYLITNDNRVYDCRVECKSRERYEVKLNRRAYEVSIVDPRRLRTNENSDRHHDGPTEIAAQMPGKVVRVLVAAGAEVQKGAGIVMVEAMKMQNEMKTPRAGTVISLNVSPGDTVNAGEVLATVGDAE
jgi:biotin carboxyl carrier protein